MVNESLPSRIRNRELNGGRINHNTNPLERCVICHKHTQYRFNTHNETRGSYVEGCGQLCPKCYNNTYESSSNNTYKEQFN